MDIELSYNNIVLDPAPTLSYSTELLYSNNIVVGYKYNITLNGFCMGNIEDINKPYGISTILNTTRIYNNIFSSNGGFIKLRVKPSIAEGGSGNWTTILYAVDIQIKSISFNESNNHWTGYVPYTIELSSNHLHLGDVSGQESMWESGQEDINATDDFISPYIVNINNHKIKTFTENFSFNVDDNAYNQIALYNEQNNPGGFDYTSFINNNYVQINYSLSAVGKHDIYLQDSNKGTLPSWEHAKRWVHTRLNNQIIQMYNGFFMTGGAAQLNELHSEDNINPLIAAPNFILYNETLNFGASESEGSFNAEYSAIAKQACSIQGSPGCINNAIHTVKKTVSKEYNANETINDDNQDTSISIEGQITGLIPGGGVFGTGGLKLDLLGTGSFLTHTDNKIDKNVAAQELLSSIFDFYSFDFNDAFKLALGIDYSLLRVSPSTIIRPSKMTLTRNYLSGIINYSAEYNNKYNCETNHYDIKVDVDEPTPIIKEFIIPNNNHGYSVIQKLSTQTAKKINVSITGNIGDLLNKCCLGVNNNWNLLNLNMFSLTDFNVPPGIALPEINPNFVLTNRTKQVTFPNGDFTINLAYTCASVCNASIK